MGPVDIDVKTNESGFYKIDRHFLSLEQSS